MDLSIYQQEIAQNNYAFVSLELSEEEMNVFNEIQCDKRNDGQYNRFGNLELIKEELPQFLREIGNNTDDELIQKATKIIWKIILHITKVFNKKTAYICIRTSGAHHGFDIPRWHMDGLYYSTPTGTQYKFVTALKGSQTLFYSLSSEQRKDFITYMRESWKNIDYNNNDDVEAQNKIDRDIFNKLFDIGNALSAPRGFGGIFVVGDISHATLHSEPKFDTERLFISVLPGDEDEIRQFENYTIRTKREFA